jgi:hypothetical protein
MRRPFRRPSRPRRRVPKSPLEQRIPPRRLTLTEIAVRLRAPVSSIQKLVNGLTAVGYLDEEDQHRFLLGPAPYVLSLRSRRLPIRDIRHDGLVALSQTAGLPKLLAVRVGLNAMYVDWAGTDEPFDYALAAGMRAPHIPRTEKTRVTARASGNRTSQCIFARKGWGSSPLSSTRLAAGLRGSSTHRLQPVYFRGGNRGAHHVARLACRPGPAAMHGRAVVPHHHVALAPRVCVACAGGGRRSDQLGEQFLRRFLLHALDRVGVRGDV